MKSSALLGASVAALFAGSTILMTAAPNRAEAKNGLGKAIGVGVGIAIVGGALSKMKFKKKKKRYKKGVKRKKGTGKKVDTAENELSADDYRRSAKDHAEKTETKRRIEQNEKAEKKRNVALAVSTFIGTLKTNHERLRSGSKRGVEVGDRINQVTSGEIERALYDAYKQARLTDFDRYAGELWTRDRLQVRILQEAQKEIAPYFKGVGAQGPSMIDLRDTVFPRAARTVYAQALELSEIIGVSRSFDRFIRTIYENSDRAPQALTTIGADKRYERLLTRTINKVDRRVFLNNRPNPDRDPLGLERQFQFQFRARRVLYDCLSNDYAKLATEYSGQFIEASATPGQQGTATEPAPYAQQGQGYEAANATTTRNYGRRARSSYTRVSEKIETAKPVEMAKSSVGQNGGGESHSSLWDRVRYQVKNQCWQSTLRVVERAKSPQGIKPQPARWNSAAASNGGIPLYGSRNTPVTTTIPRLRY